MADVKKQLVIKTNVVRRLTKEMGMYEGERKQEQTRVDKLKADGADSHDIKHAEEVLAEANMMIPNTTQRLSSALEDLLEVKDEAESSQSETEEWSNALAIIEAAQKLLGE